MHTEDHSISLSPVIFKDVKLPAFNFNHIDSLTDDTGMIQHAMYNLPNRKEGYCIDDNSRALMLAVFASKNKKNDLSPRLIPVYLSFIHYMQTDKGHFKNFMSYNKESFEEYGSEDSFGRTIMALGFLVHQAPTNLLAMTGHQIFAKAFPNVRKLISIRGIANSIVGVCQFIKYNYPDDVKRDMVIELADKMTAAYRANKIGDWHWFEPVLTYDNALLPLALLNAYEVTQDEKYFDVAFEAMHFLESKVFHNEVLRPIGNDGWLKRNGKQAQFDQQGIDVMAMVLFYQQALRLTGEDEYLIKMYKSYQWFRGANDLGIALYDPATGGCADGLHSTGVSLNQGAESTLSYWISHLVMAEALAR
ncbi:glycosyltransferase [Pinibacter aurantiacus]|uniref:Glycosyltransferase n=1 Tax=Pinibacter aurantiacus TaxID=2851599 RepID=A0A9E2W6Y9_9BACT|nr:glycosyltransferase [Pinibacter aurantiacus]MBV4355831.1 glycosyltransferase [Pinibacter aurantiacus]